MRELKEIPDNIKQELLIKPVKWIDDVLEIALQHMPEPLSDEQYLDRGGDDQQAVKDDVGRLSTH